MPFITDDCPVCAGSGVLSRLGCTGREPYRTCQTCRGEGTAVVVLTDDQYRRYQNGECIEMDEAS